jgi:hypothetical protein
MILANALAISPKTSTSSFMNAVLNMTHVLPVKTPSMHWNDASTSAPFPRLLLILPIFVLTSVGCPLSVLSRQSKTPLSLQEMSIAVLAGLLPTLTAGMKMSPPMLSFLTLLRTTMASWVIRVAQWLKFMLENEAPDASPMA